MCEVGLVQISDMKLNDYNSIIVTVNSLIFEFVIKLPRFEFVLIVMKQNHSPLKEEKVVLPQSWLVGILVSWIQAALRRRWC